MGRIIIDLNFVRKYCHVKNYSHHKRILILKFVNLRILKLTTRLFSRIRTTMHYYFRQHISLLK